MRTTMSPSTNSRMLAHRESVVGMRACRQWLLLGAADTWASAASLASASDVVAAVGLVSSGWEVAGPGWGTEVEALALASVVCGFTAPGLGGDNVSIVVRVCVGGRGLKGDRFRRLEASVLSRIALSVVSCRHRRRRRRPSPGPEGRAAGTGASRHHRHRRPLPAAPKVGAEGAGDSCRHHRRQ